MDGVGRGGVLLGAAGAATSLTSPDHGGFAGLETVAMTEQPAAEHVGSFTHIGRRR